VSEPLEVLENVNKIDTQVSKEKNTEEITIPNYIYRIGRTDIWGCRNCKFKDDIWFMKIHPCSNNKNN
jgi:hypothetical protein